MKRIILLASLLALTSAVSAAQEISPHAFEIGVGSNAFGIIAADGGGERYSSPGAFFEYRFSVEEHFELGCQLNYKFGYGESEILGPGSATKDITYNQFGLKAVVDYNSFPASAINPFLGMGAGAGVLLEKTESGSSDRFFGTIGPRIGIQIWRLRFCIEADLAFGTTCSFLPTPSSLSLNIGFCF